MYSIIKNLITAHNISVFIFGSKSEFNSLCYEVVTEIKQLYPYIKRVYVRAEYPVIDDDYKKHLLGKYEYTYFPEKLLGATKAVYVKRNYEMINSCDYCVFFFDEAYSTKKRKSGTKIALDYAVKQNKKIFFCEPKTYI